MFYGRLFVNKPNLDSYKDSAAKGVIPPAPIKKEIDKLQHSSEDATLVTSTTGPDPATAIHYPVIDIDVPINLVPASRIGHTHLYINHPVSQEGLFEILEVLAKHGIVEQGYVGATKTRGYSGVRVPWVKKVKEIK